MLQQVLQTGVKEVKKGTSLKKYMKKLTGWLSRRMEMTVELISEIEDETLGITQSKQESK